MGHEHDLVPGGRFGSLTIRRVIGRGAYGTVYLAHDPLIDRLVALKVLEAAGTTAPHERKRLLREARLIGKLKGTHIATLYRVHPLPHDAGWAFEMEYVEAGSLQDLLGADRVLPPDRAWEIARGMLEGLREAHAAGIVHGDIKPGNVLLGVDGNVKLVDFGLSRLVEEAAQSRSSTSELVGTPVFMAPEVVMGETPAAPADLWSAGVVFYRMLSGRVPFVATSLQTLFYAIQNVPPPPLDPSLPEALTRLTLACLRKDPARRPASAAEALAQLGAAARGTAVRHGVRGPAPPRVFGRARERETLRRAAEAAAEGRGTTVLLAGDAGTGKSLLAEETVARTGPLGFRWIRIHVTPLEGVLRPLLASARDLVIGEEPLPDARHALEGRLFGSATELLRTLLEDPGPIEVESRQQLLWGIERLLGGLAATGPVGVLVEDAQLACAGDRQLLDELSRRLHGSNALLLVLHRTHDPEGSGAGEGSPDALLQELGARREVEVLRLGPLPREDLARLLHDRTPDARLAPPVLRHILKVAEGNPLFALEMLGHLRASGAVAMREGALAPTRGWAGARLPNKLREMTLLRLRELPEEHRALLDIAAADGADFDGEALAAVSGRPLLEVLRGLQEVFRTTGLIVPRDRGYRFASGVVQEGIYEDLAPALRRELHRSLAEHLEGRSGSVLPERLGLHWERAGERDRARPHLRHAALQAARRQEALRCIDLLERGDLAPGTLGAQDALENPDLLFEAASCYGTLGRYDEAETILLRLRDGAASAGEEELRLRAQVRLYQVRYVRRGLAGVDEAIVESAATRLRDSEYRGRARYLLGSIAKVRGDLDRAEACFREADREFESRNLLGLHASTLDQLGSVFLRRGRWREAEALYADATRIAGVAGRRTDAAVSEVNGAVAAFRRGAVDGLDLRIERTMRRLSLDGATTQVAHAGVILAQVRYALGDLPGSRQAIQDSLDALRRHHYLVALASATLHCAELRAVTGDLDTARTDLDEAQGLVRLREDDFNRLNAALVGTHVALFRGSAPEAERAAAEAVATVRLHPDVTKLRLLGLGLAESVLFGLPGRFLDEVDRLLVDGPAEGADTLGIARKASAGARAFAARGDPAAMDEAAAALGSSGVGERRAVYRLLGRRLAAESHRRRGRDGEAVREAEAGLQDASLLGHVWLELHFLRFLAPYEGAEERLVRFHDLRGRMAARLADDGDARRLEQAWASR